MIRCRARSKRDLCFDIMVSTVVDFFTSNPTNSSTCCIESRRRIVLGPETDSLSSMGSLASSTFSSQPSPTRHGIDQLALNMGFGGIKPSIAQPSSPSSLVTTSLIPPHPQPVAIQSIDSQTSLHSNDNISIGRKPSPEIDGDVEERVITKVDPIEMTAKATTESVQKDSNRRAALLLNGPKFQLNSKEIAKGEMKIDTDTIYPVAVSENKNPF